MAGFWTLSNTVITDQNGKPLVGAKAYFYDAATTTPQDVFKDYGLGVEHPNPIESDGYGRWPAVYLDEANEFLKVRVTTAGGTLIFQQDNIPIIGPTVSEGGGGDPATPVDPSALFGTRDVKIRFGTGQLDGYVRMNGRTVGSASSGASERAHADTQSLFEELWPLSYPGKTISGGAGASASADWAANKTITLPDMRGRAAFGLDQMGSGSSSGLIPSGSISGGAADTLGSYGGAGEVTLTEAQIPAHPHTATSTQGAHDHDLPFEVGGAVQVGSGGTTSLRITTPGTATKTGTRTPAITTTIASTGGGAAHNNMPGFFLLTFYIKL